MTTPYLAADIGRDEGLRLHAYPDPDTGAEPWTIGYGCTGADIGPGLVWTLAQAQAALTPLGFEVATHVSPRLGHSIDEAGLRQGEAFLRRVLG